MFIKNPDYETIKKLVGKFNTVEVERSPDETGNRDLINTLLKEGYTVKHTATGFKFEKAKTEPNKGIPLCNK